MKKDHIKTYIIIAILISVIGMGIAYAALSQQLQIKTNASVQSSQTSWNIVMTKELCYGQENYKGSGGNRPRNVEGYSLDIKGEVDAKVQSISGPTTTFSGTGSNASADANLVQSNMNCQYGDWWNPRKSISIGDTLPAGVKKEIEVGYCFSINMPNLPTNPVTFSSTFSINFEQA